MSNHHAALQPLIEQLRQVAFFSVLDEAALFALAQHARQQRYRQGEIVFMESEPSRGLYWLQSGWLKAVKYAASGREQVLRLIPPQQTFNEVGAFTTLPNLATVVALEAAHVWLIPRQAIMHLIYQQPAFAQHVVETMAARLQHLVALVEDLSLRSVINRLARLLLDEAVDDVLLRPRWYTQSELAARLGTVVDVLQRALRKLEQDGLIKVERHQIQILNRPALESLAFQ